MARQPLSHILLAGLAPLILLWSAGCEERAENSPEQQPPMVKSKPVKARQMGQTPTFTSSQTDFWGQPVNSVNTGPKPQEPNFWDMSTWRLDFWNVPSSTDSASLATHNESLNNLMETSRKQQEYRKKHGSPPPSNPPENQTNFPQRDAPPSPGR